MTASGTAARAGDSDALQGLARVGLVAYGVVHLLVAWLALQLAWGGGGGSADQSGALATLAGKPLGKPLLWVIAVGLFALALWQLAELLRLRSARADDGKEKAKAGFKAVKTIGTAVVYAALGWSAVQFATGGGGSSAGQQQQAVSGVLGWPGGRFWVVVAAAVLLGIGVYHVHKGVTRKFLEDIDTASASPRATRTVERLGLVGFPAKGVALALVGALLAWAAFTFDPEKASGLDGAMRTVLDAPAGQWLLTLVALGIVAFGVYLLFRARYPQR
ncbi:DUF1206 domain-containing protein [Modestobacter sp. NPDC049651]|uniref:DUF1206 domain-containing protein n=1 Tax=unclassified Modestobacter TaxID=2643866 RepID=UPI0033EAD1D1